MIRTKEEILKVLSEHKKDLQKKYPLKSIALFGSFARGEQKTDSNIDLLVDFTEPVGMELIELVLELEEILGSKVDVVTYNAIQRRLFPYIKQDLTYV
jgi:uncharacterized protein